MKSIDGNFTDVSLISCHPIYALISGKTFASVVEMTITLIIKFAVVVVLVPLFSLPAIVSHICACL